MLTELKHLPQQETDVLPAKAAGLQSLFATQAKRNVLLGLSLSLLVIVIYSRVSNNAFINFDDRQYITENAHVRAGLSWETVKWAFTSFDAANWHPLTWLSHAFDYELFGLNPAGHHFVSVLFHAANAALLFLLFESLTGFAWRSLLVAALFAVHPINVESVVWAAERKNVLSMFFFLLAVLAYCWYSRQRSAGRYLAVSGLFALALMSKPQVITFPFALLLIDYWSLRRLRAVASHSPEINAKSFSTLLAEKIPWFAMSALSAFITLRAQNRGNAVRTAVEYSFSSRFKNAITSYVWYLRDVFFPRHLAPIYPHLHSLIAGWKVLLGLAILLGVSVFAILNRKRAPYLLFGWLWFLGILVPMIGLVQVGEQARADRYMYIPAIGIFVMIVWGGAELVKRFQIAPLWSRSASVLIMAALAAVTYRQIGFWKNSETLWTYTLSVTKDNFMAEDNLAQELATQGRTEEALVHFHKILNLHNWRPSDLIALGMYEQRNGYAADAINEYQRALEKANDPGTRAAALSDIGSAYLDLRKTEEAERSFNTALEIDPNNLHALIGSGLVAQKEGKTELAVHQYSVAVSLKPTDLGYELLGRALEQSGNSSEANQAFKRAQALSPNYDNTRTTAEHLLKR
ncbi:MAG TPA: tetratricopeptide repeat protein [Terriglobales bacterium]|nr:tetratricopeptide repeat protein [Terriglobales bacterium]